MTPDVFISYAPDDASFVAQLRQRLNDRGITTWLEMHDLTAATDRSTAISTAIKDSALFLLILSPESVGYAEVSKQLSFAAGEGKSILPLVWRATELPPAFAYHLSGLQPVRFDGVASSEHFDRLAQIIIDLNGQRSLTNILTQPNRPSLSDWPETGSIQAFRHLYLGGEERPVPFGGRVQTLVALDRWLDQPDQPPYLLLAAPAGRGKSALLVRWTQGLRNQAGDKLTLIFMPVSIRYQTNSAVFVFGELANRLARLHGETRASGIHASAEMLRVEVQTYLQRPLPDGQQLLLVLDGVDEAADWQFGPDLLPVTPPPGLRVLVSARLTAYAPDEAAWLARLAWSSALAQTLSLPPLNPAGVADVLRQMGLPLDQLGDRTEIVAELHRLSEGDPLLVGLYVEDLWRRRDQAARLQPADLRHLQPGLAAYFERWWEDQRKLWGGRATHKVPATHEILDLLACALGPLNRADLYDLARPEAGLTSSRLVQETVSDLARFIIGDGQSQGYAFSHPRLAQHFYEALSLRERQEWERRILAWGAATLSELQAETLRPEQAPAYLVRHYGTHLSRATDELNLPIPPEEWLAMVSNGWRQAWERLEGATYGGFLTDVNRAWQVAIAANQQAAQVGEQLPFLAEEIRCALCQASVNNLAENLSPELLATLIDSGLWTSEQGLFYARQRPTHWDRIKMLIQVMRCLMTDAEKTAILMEAREEAREIRDRELRVEWMAMVAELMPEQERVALLGEALSVARKTEHRMIRTRALAGVARQFAKIDPVAAVKVAREIEDSEVRVEGMAAVAELMPEQERVALLEEVLVVARDIENRMVRVRVLAEVAGQLAATDPTTALVVVREIEDFECRAETLLAIMKQLAEAERNVMLTKALEVAREIEDFKCRAETLGALAGLLEKVERRPVLMEALKEAREIKEPNDRVQALTTLAGRLVDPERSLLLTEILELTQEIKNDGVALMVVGVRLATTDPMAALRIVRELEKSNERGPVFAAVAEHLASIDPVAALGAAREIEDSLHRAETLIAVATRMDKDEQAEVLIEAVEAARNMKDSYHQVKTLVKIAKHLTANGQAKVLAEALKVARKIEDGPYRVETLMAVATRMDKDEQVVVLTTALEEARAIKKSGLRTEIMAAVAMHVMIIDPVAALGAAREIEDSLHRAEMLAALAKYLVPEKQAAVLAEALEIAQTGNSWRQVNILTTVVKYLVPKEQVVVLEKALNEARKIKDQQQRVELLTMVTKHLLVIDPLSALKVAREIEDSLHRAEMLAALAKYLAPEKQAVVLEEALNEARKIEDGWHRAYALATVVKYLAAIDPVTAFDVVQEIEDSWQRAKTLIVMATRMDKNRQIIALTTALELARVIKNSNLRTKILTAVALQVAIIDPVSALKIARKIKVSKDRVRVLVTVAGQLAQVEKIALLEEAIETAREIEDSRDRVEVLSVVAERMGEMPLGQLYNLWGETLPVLACRPRPELLQDLAALAPVISRLGGNQALLGTAQAVREVGEWWP